MKPEIKFLFNVDCVNYNCILPIELVEESRWRKSYLNEWNVEVM